MSLGLGIFLSSLILGLGALFLGTKDRWNWKKIILRFVFICVGISIIGGIGLFTISYIEKKSKKQNIESNVHDSIQNRFMSLYTPIIPKVHTSLWELDININKNDVKFIKGEPDQIEANGDLWIYNRRFYSPKSKYELQITYVTYVIKFYNGKLCRIFYSENRPYRKTGLDRIGFGYTTEQLFELYGEPNEIKASKDSLTRYYRYDKYNLNFKLEKNTVVGYAIFSPECKDPLSIE